MVVGIGLTAINADKLNIEHKRPTLAGETESAEKNGCTYELYEYKQIT